MDRELLHDYLLRSGMDESQATALSHLLAQTATRNDLLVMETTLKADLRLELQLLKADLQELEHKFDGKIESLKADLTWRMIGSLVLLATIMTLLDVFVD